MAVNNISCETGLIPENMYKADYNAKVQLDRGDAKETKSKTQCFQNICKKYPNAAFVVADQEPGSLDGFYPYSGMCNTSSFGYPNQMSFLIPEKVLEKMSDPEYEKRVYNQMDVLIYNYRSITEPALGGNMKHVVVQMLDLDDTDRDHLGFTVMASEGPMNAYIYRGRENTGLHQEWIKRTRYYGEQKYNEMLDELFQKKLEISDEMPDC